ncbi:MAG: helix-turn-helix domain-containing protein [Deltaproteobacteria bacterium]|nr:helix-turn-helix domain-containing protein [Deltaproteobacteria bacterium]MBF0524744.1 helix-turn-helix domain-containing protein [Deltaproteobacteria bacterium]
METQTNQRPQWLDDKQVAEMTGLGLQTLRNHRFTRQGMPYAKIGKTVRYRLDDVVRFMDAHRIVPEAAQAQS